MQTPGPCGGRENPRQVWSRVFGSFGTFGCSLTVACRRSDKTIEFSDRATRFSVNRGTNHSHCKACKACKAGERSEGRRVDARGQEFRPNGTHEKFWPDHHHPLVIECGRRAIVARPEHLRGLWTRGKRTSPLFSSPLIPVNSHHGLSEGRRPVGDTTL
ncbi:uncharacterized protein BO66DRAFT_31369 [Aspergillus aculeatinus CBS 121060]|uniref:Uncharacterized protein n=1 Tax=Aspergillus aculeatinus CBS 121060 TaxID=1448322 RepID=A0ACD1HFH7_9EURO|nr:hypothetical protein BO66DRAFT_31369 [Aspergillus aculeatinus CBS 121060]RAH72313.1 hypothetical protein BO66DRAFT_31369 [Aspergillus aculeatinus CBS 121060]